MLKIEHSVAGSIAVLALIETARGRVAAEAIASAPRVARIGLGEADLAASSGISRSGPGRFIDEAVARSAREVAGRAD